MNWKWWVAVQLCILAYIGEIIIPYSEAMLLSIVYKLDKRLFWAYTTFDAILYVRSFTRTLPTMSLNPKDYHLPTIDVPITNPIPRLPPDPYISLATMIGAGVGLVFVSWFLYVKPIRAILRLRRRILREILHIS